MKNRRWRKRNIRGGKEKWEYTQDEERKRDEKEIEKEKMNK